MTEAVVSSFETYLNLEAESHIAKAAFCREDGYCVFLIEKFQVQIFGNGIAQILTSTQAPHGQYHQLCASMFSGLANTNIQFANEVIAEAFTNASQSGRYIQDINSIQINIGPDINNIIACEFFKYCN